MILESDANKKVQSKKKQNIYFISQKIKTTKFISFEDARANVPFKIKANIMILLEGVLR